MAPSEGPWPLPGSSPRAPQALSEAGLAQVSDPSCPRFSFLEGGGSRGWGRESAISILSGLLSPSLFVPRTPARTERGEEGSGGAGRRGRGGEPAGWCPPLSGAQAPGSWPGAKGGEPELCGACKEPGRLPARRRRRPPPPQPNGRRADNVFSNPRSVPGAGGRVAGLGGGSPLPAPAPAALLPAPLFPPAPGAHTHTFPDN